METLQGLVAIVVIVTSGLWWAEHLWAPLAEKAPGRNHWARSVTTLALALVLVGGGLVAVWAFLGLS